MSHLELITRYYGYFNAGDFASMVDCVTEDFAHDPNQGTRRVGKAQFREFLAKMERCYEERVSDLVIMESGDRAAAEFLINGKYVAGEDDLPPARGQTYTLPVGAFFELREGKIARLTNYYNLADWLAQVSA
ncbi:MAG: ketosteroid isomerase-related protein [Kofleriaceae bacterium]